MSVSTVVLTATLHGKTRLRVERVLLTWPHEITSEGYMRALRRMRKAIDSAIADGGEDDMPSEHDSAEGYSR